MPPRKATVVGTSSNPQSGMTGGQNRRNIGTVAKKTRNALGNLVAASSGGNG